MDKTFTNFSEVVELPQNNSKGESKQNESEPDEKVLSFLSKFAKAYHVSKAVAGTATLPIAMILN
ncbi:MAG: hypothetical protein M0P12_08965 [Paludibacteraceae bacterium]|jgi:hypothetical protein|nr:hypothetical protein [Paludibacteraceae bacterium]HPH63213.1 hypothetical protein [Paludibacteraceae bacterium]